MVANILFVIHYCQYYYCHRIIGRVTIIELRMSVGWLVGCNNFLNGREVTLPCFYRSSRLHSTFAETVYSFMTRSLSAETVVTRVICVNAASEPEFLTFLTVQPFFSFLEVVRTSLLPNKHWLTMKELTCILFSIFMFIFPISSFKKIPIYRISDF